MIYVMATLSRYTETSHTLEDLRVLVLSCFGRDGHVTLRIGHATEGVVFQMRSTRKAV
jgi:hypothetical protein